MFTQVRSANRRVVPAPTGGRAVMKAVYVVLEPQYQNALTQAATSLNDQNGPLAIELSGYLIEELRDPDNYADFCADVAAADVFIASLIFIEDLAQKVVEAVAPHRDRLKAAVVFPSMPEVMRLNKLGSFSMAQLGQSKSAIASFMKKRKEAGGAGRDAQAAQHPADGVEVFAGGEGPGRPVLHAQLPVLAGRYAGQSAQFPADAGG
jgi:magnesium chelatase subunit H